ncbi:MAG: PA4642 family protein [Oleiphilaceae bacterium]|nr:PA4642 family protein [Oleiphilaceae bacterium]
MSGPSQPKVEGEQWSDDRIKAFLDLKPLDGENPDYHVLHQAYQHMTPNFFARFVPFFVADGRDINARSLKGETMLERVAQHRRSTEYAAILREHGAA